MWKDIKIEFFFLTSFWFRSQKTGDKPLSDNYFHIPKWGADHLSSTCKRSGQQSLMSIALPQGYKRVNIIGSDCGIFFLFWERKSCWIAVVYPTSQKGEEAPIFQRKQSEIDESALRTWFMSEEYGEHRDWWPDSHCQESKGGCQWLASHSDLDNRVRRGVALAFTRSSM